MKGFHKLIYLLLLLSTSKLCAANIYTSDTDSLIKTGIELSLSQAYDASLAIFESLEQQMPEEPAGYFYQAAVIQTRMMDYERYDDFDRFREKLVQTITVSRNKLKQNKNDAWAHFYTGASYGYLAFSLAKQMKYVEAFKNGRKSIIALEQALAADSTLYDAYLGLGAYKYYRSNLSRHLAWLPFIDDERDTGVKMVRQAMTKSHYSQFSAINSLCWILMEEKQYEESYRIIRDVLVDHPDSRIFLWCAAKLAKKMARWQESVSYYKRILNSFTIQGVDSPYNELSCRKSLVELYQTIGRLEEAAAQCQYIESIEFDNRSKKRASKKLKELKTLCSDCITETVMLQQTN